MGFDSIYLVKAYFCNDYQYLTVNNYMSPTINSSPCGGLAYFKHTERHKDKLVVGTHII